MCSDGEHVKHVTYLQNGAVISNVPNSVPTVINNNNLQPPPLYSVDYQDKQDDAFVLQNPLISDDNGEFSQNQVNQDSKLFFRQEKVDKF